MDSNYSDVVLRPGGGRRCRVLYSYSPQNEDELQLQVNDEIDFLAEVEDGWWRGKLRNKIGVFPSNFVCVIPPPDETCASEGERSSPLSSPDSTTNTDAPMLPPKPVKETCRVLFAYDAANDDELTLKKDDIITIITKEVEDKGWWKGELRGKIGLFPDNFVEVIAPFDEGPTQKKPDRPTKIFEKIDSKIPLISSVTIQKKIHDVVNHKEQDDKTSGSKSEGPFNKKNVHNLEKGKFDSSGGGGGGVGGGRGTGTEKALFQIKPDTVTNHRKSLELKANENQSPPITSKKPILPPPLTNKPKPAASKPSHAKRLSGEITDLIDNAIIKRLSGEVQDLIDGGMASKLSASNRPSGGSGNEDLDLDSVERSDMLTHITASRPKAPGRRPPSKELRENDVHSFLTNGNLDSCDKEKNQREWEKHKPPWVDELKSNLKSSKTVSSDQRPEKKSPLPSTVKPSLRSPTDPAAPGAQNAADLIKSLNAPSGAKESNQQSNQQNTAQKSFGDAASRKVSEFSIRLSGSERSKSALSTSPSKIVENSKNANSLSEQGNNNNNDDSVQVSKKEFAELWCKVDYLEDLVTDLIENLREEVEKRKLLEKELNKLTNLVTQV